MTKACVDFPFGFGSGTVIRDEFHNSFMNVVIKTFGHLMKQVGRQSCMNIGVRMPFRKQIYMLVAMPLQLIG